MTSKKYDDRDKLLQAATLKRKKGEVTVVCIKNPYDPEKSQVIENLKGVTTLGEIVSKFYPLMSPEFDIAVAIDGETYQGELKDLKNAPINSVSSVTFCAVPHGGGGDDGGKGIIGMLAMVVVMVVAFYAAPAIVGAMAGISSAAASATMGGAVFFTQAAIMMVGGMLVNALLPPAALDLGGGGTSYNESLTESPTYGFTSQPNPTTNGLVGPVVYGAYRVTPPIINQFITPSGNDQMYNGLYALALHKVQHVRAVYVNDDPTSYYTGVTLTSRKGDIDQTMIPAFGDVRSERSINRELSTSGEIVKTKGKNIQGLFVGVSAPRLLQTTPEGDIEQVTVPLTVEYRKVGDSTWTPFPTVVQGGTPETIEVTRTKTIFTAGYYN